MIAYLLVSVSVLLSSFALAHSQEPLGFDGTNGEQWDVKYGSAPVPLFSGPLSFSHLPYYECLKDTSHEHKFDIAILGMPFDTSTTYRPGARFGPHGIRSGSMRQRIDRSYTIPWGMSPYKMGVEIIDCGDVSVSFFLNGFRCRAPHKGSDYTIQQLGGHRPNASCL
jgi:agmatinase